MNAAAYTVVLGAHDIYVNEPQAVARKVELVIPHPKFSMTTIYNDIGLLKLTVGFFF